MPHCLARWRDDPAARSDWHLYHLIGDVLRSEDLAAAPARDARFLERLRAELVREPVPLAPAALSQPMSKPAVPGAVRRLGWRAPAAVAAGFVAVAATLVVMRPAGLGLGGGDAQLAAQGQAGLQAAGQASTAGAAGGVAGAKAAQARAQAAVPAGGPLVARGPMLRDPRLDEYLLAHQAARGGAPAALPFGGLRNAEVVVVPALPGALPGAAASEAARQAAATNAASANVAPALRPASEAR